MIPCKPMLPPTAFFGPIGGPEIIMILVVLFLLAVPVVIVVAVLMMSNSRNKGPLPPMPPPPLPSVESRLAEIDSLRARNLISEAEHEEKRKQIIGGI